jgi:TolB protein
MTTPRRHRSRTAIAALVAVAASLLCAGAPAAAAAAAGDVFNGRIAFSSVRSDPQERNFDIFSMNADGTDVRQLTTNPDGDRQPDWSPNGTALAYTIDKPNSATNFEVARMTAAGTDHRQLTTTATGQASSQPAWLPGGRGILFRRSGPTSHIASIWQMGPLGEHPALRFATPQPALYPSFSPDGRRVVYAGIVSQVGDTDRGIFAEDADGGGLTTLFDVPGAYDSGPAWSPDGTRIAFESDADVNGANPARDMEIWVMNADGSAPTQLTHDNAHSEGAAWSPDGRYLAYSSGPDNTHEDIHVMTATGQPISQLTTYPKADESPDWQAIPAPHTDRRCGDVVQVGRGAHDVRTAGRGLTCPQARALARRWAQAGLPSRVGGFTAAVKDFGGLRRVELRRRAGGHSLLVAFLYESATQ